ncbi:MAG: hypothetical protein AAF560_23650, partial [Acidobacteriota bacterium]
MKRVLGGLLLLVWLMTSVPSVGAQELNPDRARAAEILQSLDPSAHSTLEELAEGWVAALQEEFGSDH